MVFVDIQKLHLFVLNGEVLLARKKDEITNSLHIFISKGPVLYILLKTVMKKNTEPVQISWLPYFS